MAALQSVVIIVQPLYLVRIVGETMILPLFAMCGHVEVIRNGKIWWPTSITCCSHSMSATRNTSRVNYPSRCLTCCIHSVLAAISIVTMNKGGLAERCTILEYQ